MKTVAYHLLRAVRPFIKMNAEQSAAWEIVMSLLKGK
jgi:hypothetical protein